jgi:hypothetical protein
MKQTQPELLDLYRTSLQGALDWMKTSLESAERLQNQQLIAMRSALDAQLQVASQVGAAMTSLYEKQASSFKKARKDSTEAR